MVTVQGWCVDVFICVGVLAHQVWYVCFSKMLFYCSSSCSRSWEQVFLPRLCRCVFSGFMLYVLWRVSAEIWSKNDAPCTQSSALLCSDCIVFVVCSVKSVLIWCYLCSCYSLFDVCCEACACELKAENVSYVSVWNFDIVDCVWSEFLHSMRMSFNVFVCLYFPMVLRSVDVLYSSFCCSYFWGGWGRLGGFPGILWQSLTSREWHRRRVKCVGKCSCVNLYLSTYCQTSAKALLASRSVAFVCYLSVRPRAIS